MEVTQFAQRLTPSTSELHSIGPWPTRNIYLSSRWKSTHVATYFHDWLVDTNLHATSCQRDNASWHPRNKQGLALSRRAESDDQHARHNIVTSSTPGRKRLQSRHPFSVHVKQLISDAHGNTNRVWAEGSWETRWDITRCRLRTFIHTPSNKPIGHDLARHSLVCLNRIRTGYGRFKSNMNRMGLSPSASCECGATDHTAQHIASECPLRSCNGDLVLLDTAARNWLHDLQCVV